MPRRPSSVLYARAGLALGLLLAGCRSLPPADWPAQRAQLQAITAFEFDGAIAVQGAAEPFGAGLHWQQQGARAQLRLRAPLGLGAGARVHLGPEGVGFEDAHGTVLAGEAAQAQLRQLLGAEAPLASLRYWLLGVPDPATTASETLDRAQRLVRLQQDGWQLSFGEYAVVGGRWLPCRLRAVQGGVTILLRVRRWKLP